MWALNLDPVSIFNVFWSAASGVSQAVQALKGEVDVLIKGVGERNVAKEVKHILEMVVSCFFLVSSP